MAAGGPKAHLLDGTYELFRHFFAIPPRQAPDGREVAAVWGVMQSILGLLREPGVTHLAVATDHVIESFRNDLFAGYKTGDGIPPDLWSQFPLLEEAVEALGVMLYPMVELEADDALATAAARLSEDERVSQVRILSPDKDLAQCVMGSRVVCVDRRSGRVLDDAGVRAKFGIEPRSIPDYLALVGDDADGIPGIPGWGAVSASTILARYVHLEAVPRLHAAWDVKVRGALRLGTALHERWDDALLYRRLATLRTDGEIPCRLEDLRWDGAPRDRFFDFCRRNGFGDLADRSPRTKE